jgi:TRAP-type C4-dicarboxylate transport system permease small subunit
MIYENKKEKLISFAKFKSRIMYAVYIDIILLSVSLLMGVMGYHYFNNLSYVDAFMNASMILGGMGPVDPLINNTAKIFAGVYALYSGIAFLTSFAILIAPVYHRFLHKFHLEEKEAE